jgi:hypothetical protein
LSQKKERRGGQAIGLAKSVVDKIKRALPYIWGILLD